MKAGYFSSRRGQTLVEWALLLPILLFIMFLVIDFGRGIYYYSVVNNAAREGARYGAVFPDDITGIKDAVRQKAIGLDNSLLTIPDPVFIDDDSDDDPFKRIIVTVEYAFFPIVPYFGSDGINLQGSAKMMVEQ
jgi:hypothetical protein